MRGPKFKTEKHLRHVSNKNILFLIDYFNFQVKKVKLVKLLNMKILTRFFSKEIFSTKK
jgi:hypothetical protein